MQMGSLVCWHDTGHPRSTGKDLYGVVFRMEKDFVSVRWEDGRIGILYFDSRYSADANKLEVIEE